MGELYEEHKRKDSSRWTKQPGPYCKRILHGQLSGRNTFDMITQTFNLCLSWHDQVFNKNLGHLSQ